MNHSTTSTLRALILPVIFLLACAMPALAGTLAPGEGSATAPAAGGISLFFGALAALAFTRPRFLVAMHRHSGPGDDALPGAPVYETDASPD